ncbi:MAG: hypothetical protein WBH75_15920 [Thermoanaerobaculia bacterium]
MSLINEALKRAKQETNRREAAQKGVPLPLLERAPRRTPWTLVAVGILGAALVASLTALFMLSRGQAPPVARPEPSPVAESQIEPVVEATTTAPSETTLIEEQQATSSNTGGSETDARQDPLPTTPTTQPIPEVPSAVIADPTLAGVPAIKTESEGAPIEPEGSTYLHRAELADGVTLELGGIAWSGFDPIALINGKAVGQGERVNGYLVVQIDPQQVEMRGEVGSIFIRLK